MTSQDDDADQQLDADQLSDMAQKDLVLLERANKTITNLLRREPIIYMEVAQNALIRTLEKEKIQIDGRNQNLMDRLDAIREAVRGAKHGDPVETLLLVSKIETILGEDV